MQAEQTPHEGKVLVVDDERDICDTLCEALQDDGYQAEAVRSGAAALKLLKEELFDIIIIDIKMPKMDGIELLRKAHELDPEMLSMIITGYPSMESTIVALKVGAYDYITKPFNLDDIKLIVRRGMERQRLAAANRDLLRSLKKAVQGLEEYSKTLESKVAAKTAELQEIQGRLVRSERMRAVGELAVGVAHELNNPVHAILRNAKKTLERISQGTLEASDLKACKVALRGVKNAADHCSKVIGNLVSFSRQAKPEFRSLDINEVLDEALSLASTSMEGIQVVKEYTSELPKVWGDPDQLKHVFLDLILTGTRSMTSGGSLRVSTRKMAPEVGKMVCIEFSDTGCGIPPKDLTRIFDPGFTPRQIGETVGVGLPICHSIITSHGGYLEVESGVGHGTTFTIRLAPARIEPCWKVLKCPPKVRSDCPACSQTEGERCWTFGGIRVKEEAAETDQSWFELCKKCKVYRQQTAPPEPQRPQR